MDKFHTNFSGTHYYLEDSVSHLLLLLFIWREVRFPYSTWPNLATVEAENETSTIIIAENEVLTVRRSKSEIGDGELEHEREQQLAHHPPICGDKVVRQSSSGKQANNDNHAKKHSRHEDEKVDARRAIRGACLLVVVRPRRVVRTHGDDDDNDVTGIGI